MPLLALERPAKNQLLRYSQDGSLAIRIQNSLALGNHLVSPRLVRDYIGRILELGLKPLLSSESTTNLQNNSRRKESKILKSVGSVKALALLISFPEYPAAESPESIASKLFGEGDGNWPYESLRNYYRRSSYNALNIEGGVLGWYTPPYARSGMPQTPEAREKLIKDALLFYRSQGHDFSQYDKDGDGAIDYLMVVWTGPDEGWGGFWWEYQTGFSDASFSLNGTTLDQTPYAWLPAIRFEASAFDSRAAIHETGHALGLPDYYDYVDGIGPQGSLGGLDMMDGECGDHNAFSKMLLGWISPQVFDLSRGEFSLRASGNFPEALLIVPNSSAKTLDEFYLVQNRFRVENDFNFPAEGLLAWHVDARIAPDGHFLSNNSLTDRNLLSLRKLDSSFSDASAGLSISGIGPSGLTQYFTVALRNGSSSSIIPLASGTSDGSPSSLSPRIQAQSASATYYVDATAGSDTSSGLAPATPWKTIAKVNRMTFQPGDSILFKRGETWREQLQVPSSGSLGNRITFGKYGSPGADPVFNCSSLVTGMAAYSTYVWQKTGITTEPAAVFFNGEIGYKQTSLGGVDSVFDWYWASNVLYIYSASNPATLYAAPGIEQSTDVSAVNCPKSYITIDGITAVSSGGNGIKVYTSPNATTTDVTIQNCTVRSILSNGIIVINMGNSGPVNPMTNVNVSGSTVSNCGQCGIYYQGYMMSGTISRNTVYTVNYFGSLYGIGATSYIAGGPAANLIVEYNTIHDVVNGGDGTAGHGINACTGSQDMIIRYNLVYNNGGNGISSNQATGSRIYYNIVYGNNTGNNSYKGGYGQRNSNNTILYNNVFYKNKNGGIFIYDSSGETYNISIKNNIIAESSVYELWIGAGTVSGFVSDNNCVYHSAGGTFMAYAGAPYSWANWKTNSRQDANAVNADPKFVNAASNDFHITSASPCTNTGANVGLTQDYEGNVVPASAGTNADIGAYEYQPATGKPTVTLLAASPAPPQGVGTPITWTATATGGTAPLQFRFYLYSSASNSWTLARDYAATNAWTWTPTQPGQYAIQVWVRNAGSTATYDAWKGSGYLDISGSAPSVTSLAASPALPQGVGTTITWTAIATGGSAPLEYKYWLYNASTGWVMMRDFNTSNTWSWTPTQPGQYAVQVWVRITGSAANYDAWKGSGYFDITGSALSVTTLTASPALPQSAGTTITWTATATGGTAPLQYRYYLYSTATNSWTVARDYSTSNTWTWTPAQAGQYAIQVWVRNAGSTATYDAWKGSGYFNIR